MARTESMRGTLDLLADTVPKSTQGWTPHPRTKVALLLPRSHRPEHEGHPGRVSIARPAWSCFIRPREESAEIAAAGIDPRETSFQFLDIAMEDLGRWVGPLVATGWGRVEIPIEPAVGAAFFAETWPCFHHPDIAAPSRLPLTGLPTTIDAKCWIHTPTGEIQPAAVSVMQPDDAARSGTQVTGATVAVISRNDAFESDATTPVPASAAESIAASDAAAREPAELSGAVPIPADSTPNQPATDLSATTPPTATARGVDAEGTERAEDTGEGGGFDGEEDGGMDGDEEVDGPPPESETEIELRQLIQLLHADGNDMAAIMSNDSFIELSEQATIEGIDVWTMVVRITG